LKQIVYINSGASEDSSISRVNSERALKSKCSCQKEELRNTRHCTPAKK